VNNGAIATSPAGEKLQSILQIAQDRGHMVGLVTNGSITAPTSATFYAHGHVRDGGPPAAQQLVEDAKLDVVLGGGAADFAPTDAGGTRTDERDLITELRDDDYEVVRTLQDLEEVPRWRRAKLVGLFSQSDLEQAHDGESLDEQPTLADMVRRAIELLQYSRGGYVLVVDAALARKARDDNRSADVTSELLELDKAVAVALEYAGNKAAVFVCGDPSVTSKPPTQRAGSAESVGADTVEPNVEPAADPNPVERELDADVARSQAAAPPNTTPANVAPAEHSPAPTPADGSPLAEPTPAITESAPVEQQAADATTAEDAITFGIGLGANALHGSLQDTEIFEIIRNNL
jgi:alkaline phosphatase